MLMTFIALGRGNYFITINNSFLCRVRRARRLFSPSLEPEVAPNKQPTAGGKTHKQSHTQAVGSMMNWTHSAGFFFSFVVVVVFLLCVCVWLHHLDGRWAGRWTSGRAAAASPEGQSGGEEAGLLVLADICRGKVEIG